MTTGSTVIPCLRYRNAAAAIEWLCETFGFEKSLGASGSRVGWDWPRRRGRGQMAASGRCQFIVRVRGDRDRDRDRER